MDINNGKVIKGIKYENLKEVGDPIELSKRYSKEGIDELVFLDITATIEKRKLLIDLVKKIALNINIPFTVGGGISSIKDINILLKAGADKISIGSKAVLNPDFVKKAAIKFGSQCIVVSIDTFKLNDKWKQEHDSRARKLMTSIAEMFIDNCDDISDADYEIHKRICRADVNKRITWLKKYMSNDYPTDYLFYSPVSADGAQHPITNSAIQWIIKESRSKITTKKKFTAHTLRHSFATHLLEDGMNILTIKELMGHKRIETTMLYLQIAQLDNHSKFSPLDTLYKK
jgi:imidazoleglycerol phosphate synthase cyclase subunit